MTDIVTKVSIGGQVVPIGGGSTEGEEHEFITQADYDNLTPAQKAEKVYMITGEGETGGGGSAEDTSYDNTTSGLTADNVQDAIDEVNSKVSSGTMFERGDMLLFTIDNVSPIHGAICLVDTYYNNIEVKNAITGSDIYSTGNSATSETYYKNIISIDDTFFVLKHSGGYNRFEVRAINVDGTATTITVGSDHFPANEVKNDGEYWYCRRDSSYYKIDTQCNKTESTQSEFDAIPSGVYYKGLYYSQDNNDYVAVDSTGTEVKRYSGVGTINGIYDDKLYRNIGDTAYAIATI